MRLINTPFIIITIATVVGIILAEFLLNMEVSTALLFFLCAVVLLGVSWFFSKKIFSSSVFFTILMIVSFIAFGYVLVHIHNPKNHQHHYTHILQDTHGNDQKIGVEFHIRERLKPSSYYQKYIASIEYIGNQAANGKLLVQVPKDSVFEPLKIGTSYTTRSHLTPIHTPKNPHQFNYANYSSKQYIYHQIKLSKDQTISNEEASWSLLGMADHIRIYINQKLSGYDFDNKQLAIINALLLGQRQDIDTDTLLQYQNAGAIHILAVSGLHVGIIMAILSFLLQPLARYGTRGKIIKLITILIILWCFAILAGLSPSVLRAATMFSFLAIGIHIRSKTSIYNSLFISLFILLCFNPLLLFSVGLQLSYLAVFGIVWIQPYLTRFYDPKYLLTKRLWETLTVTVAAQLGVLPLSLFYFNQFPVLFFISNIMIIPFLGGILGFGIVTIALACLNILPYKIATLFGQCIDYMNQIIGWVAQQDSWLLENIFFSWKMLFALYLVIIVAFWKLKAPKTISTVWIGTSVFVCISIFILEKTTTLKQEELIVFNSKNNTVLGVLKNQTANIYVRDTSFTKKQQDFLYGNYLIQKQADLNTVLPLNNIYTYKNQIVLVIDDACIYDLNELCPDILLLTNSPKINLSRVLDTYTPKQIIADASNYRDYCTRWKKTCNQHNVPFHSTYEQGAFIIK